MQIIRRIIIVATVGIGTGALFSFIWQTVFSVPLFQSISGTIATVTIISLEVIFICWYFSHVKYQYRRYEHSLMQRGLLPSGSPAGYLPSRVPSTKEDTDGFLGCNVFILLGLSIGIGFLTSTWWVGVGVFIGSTLLLGLADLPEEAESKVGCTAVVLGLVIGILGWISSPLVSSLIHPLPYPSILLAIIGFFCGFFGTWILGGMWNLLSDRRV